MKVVRQARVGMLLTAVVLASACTTDQDRPPEPPTPAVSTVEFAHRLDEHLARFASLLQPDARVSAPVHTRVQECAGGPPWSVAPRADVTVQAGDQSRQSFENLQSWMTGNGFDGLFDGVNLYPGNNWKVDGTHTDGTTVVEQLTDGASQFTVTVIGPCTWPPERPGGPAAGRLTPLAKPSEPVSLLDGRGGFGIDSAACRSPKMFVYNDNARAAAGRGPHPMDMAVYADSRDFLYEPPTLPERWKPEDESRVQLIVCVRVKTIGGTGRKINCYYTDPVFPGDGTPYDFKIVKSTYEITVRSARTGALVRRISLAGTLNDKESCPFRLEDYQERLARGLDDKALERALRPLYGSTR